MKKWILPLLLFASLASNCQGVRDYEEAEKSANSLERQLTKQFKALLAPLKPTEKKLLQDEQTAWLKLRGAQLAIEGFQYRGGSGSGTFVLHRQIALTKERLKVLKEYRDYFIR